MNKAFASIIDSHAGKITIPGYDHEDIRHELVVYVLQHLEDCEKKCLLPDERTVTTTVRRGLYRIIRKNVKFEGCSDKTRRVRQGLASPHSNIQKNSDGMDVDFFDSLQGTLAAPGEQMAVDDLQEKFKKLLSTKELVIYEKVLDGFVKPKDICREIYGMHIECRAKTISKHLISIRGKFAKYYEQQTGRMPRNGR